LKTKLFFNFFHPKTLAAFATGNAANSMKQDLMNQYALSRRQQQVVRGGGSTTTPACFLNSARGGQTIIAPCQCATYVTLPGINCTNGFVVTDIVDGGRSV
jgi:hypothetical protein